ncbi:MAG TPA: alpha/beta hydrolase [Pseudomonadota bacterium]|nr:alpha/beta hydrolase [Pseudomonadota bacterium]HNK44039.1 alpha/beta hydrolase [Pseudomonadota bacterium]
MNIRRLCGWCALVPLGLLLGCGFTRQHAAKSQVDVVEDQPYVSASPHPKHRLDLYLPKVRHNVPLVLFVHGGFWKNQDRRYYQPFTGLHGNVGMALAQHGFAVGVTSYRLFPSANIDMQLADVSAAAQWMVDHAKDWDGRSDALFLVGFSAGGHLVMSLCADPARLSASGIPVAALRGCASLSGVLDIPALAAQKDDAFNRELTYPLFGNTTESQAAYSVFRTISPSLPPIFLLWAEKDLPFVKTASLHALQKLQQAHKEVDSFELSGYDHSDVVLRILTDRDDLTPKLVRFLSAHSGP